MALSAFLKQINQKQGSFFLFLPALSLLWYNNLHFQPLYDSNSKSLNPQFCLAQMGAASYLWSWQTWDLLVWAWEGDWDCEKAVVFTAMNNTSTYSQLQTAGRDLGTLFPTWRLHQSLWCFYQFLFFFVLFSSLSHWPDYVAANESDSQFDISVSF